MTWLLSGACSLTCCCSWTRRRWGASLAPSPLSTSATWWSDLLITTHSLPITFLLEDLKKSCKQVVFLGIQPAQLEFMEPLTPEVLKSVERIYEFLKQGVDFSHLPV